MNDLAERRGDRQRNRLWNGVADRHGLDCERPDLEGLAGAKDVHRDLRRVPLAFTLCFKQASGERRCPDRRLQHRPDVQKTAVVVLVGMGDDNALQVRQLLLNEADVRQDEIDARKVWSREGHAAIDQKPATVGRRAISVKGQIHADFADTPQRTKYQLLAPYCHVAFPLAKIVSRLLNLSINNYS